MERFIYLKVLIQNVKNKSSEAELFIVLLDSFAIQVNGRLLQIKTFIFIKKEKNERVEKISLNSIVWYIMKFKVNNKIKEKLFF